jgi:ribosome-binding protein aMBF1 (putative translation factor)
LSPATTRPVIDTAILANEETSRVGRERGAGLPIWGPSSGTCAFKARSQLRKKIARKISGAKPKGKNPQSRRPKGRGKPQTRAKARQKARKRPPKRLTAHTAAELGALIAAVRANAKQSQVRLAGALESDQANIVRLEKGRSVPSVTTLFRIAKATGHKLTVTFARLRG